MSIKTESIKRVIKLDNIVPEKTTVWLAPDKCGRAFHCQSCGGFMFYRQHRIIAILQDDMSHLFASTPMEIQCHKCGHTYFINIF